jgi:predicted nucleotidyltransferase
MNGHFIAIDLNKQNRLKTLYEAHPFLKQLVVLFKYWNEKQRKIDGRKWVTNYRLEMFIVDLFPLLLPKNMSWCIETIFRYIYFCPEFPKEYRCLCRPFVESDTCSKLFYDEIQTSKNDSQLSISIDHIKDRLSSFGHIILSGSHGRDTQTGKSDIDILFVLNSIAISEVKDIEPYTLLSWLSQKLSGGKIQSHCVCVNNIDIIPAIGTAVNNVYIIPELEVHFRACISEDKLYRVRVQSKL